MQLPCRFEDFADPGELPWLDRPDAAHAIDLRLRDGSIGAAQAERLRHWVEHGWVVLGQLLDDRLIGAVVADMDEVVATHKHLPLEQWRVKLQNRFAVADPVRRMVLQPAVVDWCTRILGCRARPFQSLSMPIGSQIPPHADHVLMTTHPQGYMIAAWFALEDAHEDAGPLTLWSGSHRLPYLSAREVGIPRDAPADECSRIYAENYYARNRQRIEAHGLRPFHYLAKRGEVLLWHANVLHGGAKITRPDSSRRSLVVHYYGEGVHHYSDLFHWPSPLPQLG